MRSLTKKSVLGTTLAVALLGTATTALAATALESDGVNLRSQWTSGGEVWLELEDRNVEPTICFVYDSAVPQDGDSFASRILTRSGAEVVDLGTSDQWIDGSGEGCQIPADERFRDVFANPAGYVVELRVVEEQGTPATPPLRSQPLRAASS